MKYETTAHSGSGVYLRRAISNLKRYLYLISLQAYLLQQETMPYADWVHSKPVIKSIFSALKSPEASLKTATEYQSLYEISGKSISEYRTGSILNASTILKTDYFLIEGNFQVENHYRIEKWCAKLQYESGQVERDRNGFPFDQTHSTSARTYVHICKSGFNLKI